jgi:hypothetical protein
MNEHLESLLDAARKLPPEARRLLAATLLSELDAGATAAQAEALEAVEKTRGTIKGLDRETVIWLAEDEELCGY